MTSDISTPREQELAARLDEVTRDRNLYARTLAEANRLYEEKVKELNALRRVGDALRSVLSVRKVCGEIVDVLVEEVGAENCSLMLLDRREGTLLLKAARGKRDAQARYFESGEPETRFKLGEGVAGWVAANAKPVLIPDTSKDERFKRAEAGGLDIRSLLCIPLVEGTQVWGVLNLSHSDINAFTEDNERILTIIAGQAGIALANLGLFRQLQDINAALEETVAVRTAQLRKMNEELEQMVAARTRELSESETRYRALFEKSAEAIFLMGEGGQILNANDRWRQLTGLGSGGESLSLAAPDGAARTLAEWAAQAADAECLLPELTLLRPDGSRRIVELRLNPVDLGGPVRRGVLGVAHDITRRKELEESLLRSEKLAAMGTLAASVAHEINNPLEGIKNCLNLLKAKLPADAREQELLDLTQKGFARIRDIVRQVLDFHRPSTKEVGPVDLHAVLNGLLGLFRNDFKNRGIALALDLAPALPPVRGNRGQLEQVFTNVILNAEDAMERGGTLTLSTRAAGGEVTVAFADTGCGIAKEDLQRVFQPFFTRKRSGKGTGLGLWITHSVVEEHHGRLDLQSEVGKGTTVSIILPAMPT